MTKQSKTKTNKNNG